MKNLKLALTILTRPSAIQGYPLPLTLLFHSLSTHSIFPPPGMTVFGKDAIHITIIL